MSVVIDLNAVCLICLQQEEGLRNIYGPDQQNPELQIAFKIGRCSNLKLDAENKKMPNKICNTCLTDLGIAWRFRQNCDTAQVIFRTILRDQQQNSTEPSPTKQLEEQKIKVPQGLKIKRVHQQDTQDSATPPTILNKKSDVDNNTSEKIAWNRYSQEKSSEAVDDIKIITVKTDDEYVDSNSVEEPYQTEEVIEYYMPEENSGEGSSNNNDDNSKKEQTRRSLEMLPTVEEEQKVKNCSTPPRKLRITVSAKENTKRSTSERVAIKQEIPEQMPPERHTRGRTQKYQHEIVTPDTPEEEEEEEDSANQSEDNKQLSEYAAHVRTRKRKTLPPDAKPPKICEICGNSYRYQHALNAHMRRHNDDKQFPCEFCDKAFVSNVELRRHIRVHTGQKPYGCQYCDRRFSDFGSRIKHERTHTGERPYHCETCGKAFAYAHVLSVHMRTHTGEKKFRCELCGKGVTKKSYLLAHLERHARANEIDNSELLDIKSVALEECILTTEYIDEDDGETEIHVLVTGEPSSENELSLKIR